MKIISHQQISALGISPSICMEWARESFRLKQLAQLPPKIGLHPQGDDFFNTMPCLLPSPINRYGCKIVSRIHNSIPALSSIMILSDSKTGEVLALMDADWITTMRTGAVAALAEQTFRPWKRVEYGFLGLGNTARATLLCMLDNEPETHFFIRLLKYKDQADCFIDRFSGYNNVHFDIVDTVEELIASSDTVISCVTSMSGVFCENEAAFREGCLVIPVHTRGFQNCDLFFDKIFGDDTGHLRGFKYFERFRNYAEFGDVLLGNIPGRESISERILSYNVGVGLHDLVFALKLFPLLKDKSPDIEMRKPISKFWL